jgi:hypothetical protein
MSSYTIAAGQGGNPFKTDEPALTQSPLQKEEGN